MDDKEVKLDQKQAKMYRRRCPVCGAVTGFHNMKRHLRSKTHRDAMYILEERFEMKWNNN
jgi:hypothetical protein